MTVPPVASTAPAPTPAAWPAPAPPATPGVGPAGEPSVDPQIVEAARGFEGILMSLLLEEMVKGTSIASGNPMYAGLITEKLGDSLAQSGGIGLAAVLERQLGGSG